MKRCARFVVLSILATFMVTQSVIAQAGQTHGPAFEETPLDLVMLIDESGSLSNADVAQEIASAGAIAQAPLNPRSRVTIIGFGGDNGVAPNQDPTSVVCQPTITNSVVNLERLATCVQALHRRTEAEGDDTDYAAALSQAMSYLSPKTAYGQQSPKGATKAIFLMTDGGLDVHRDPVYIRTGNWLSAAHHNVNLELARARESRVEIWPLGFGSITTGDAAYLKYLAANGAQTACDSRTSSQPRSLTVSSSAIALNALWDLYSAAGCFGKTPTVSTNVPPGQSRTLRVTIPPIASAGAISVDKGSSAIGVNFVTPGGTTVTGSRFGSSTFQNTGANTAIEVLHINNPMPGTWQIVLTAPKGERNQLVSATVIWQGAVRLSILPSPPTAARGERIQVTISVLSLSGPITDPDALKKIAVQVGVSGDGLSGTISVPISNRGDRASTPTGIGDYEGTFTAPNRSGELTFTGIAAGYGLHSTQVSIPVQVNTIATLMRGVVQFPGGSAQVRAGSDISGHIIVSNQTGKSQHLRLTLNSDHAFATVKSPSGVITVPSGTSQIPFSVHIGPNSPRGNAQLVLRGVSAENASVIYAEGSQLINVLSPLTFFEKYRWEFATLISALLLLALLSYARHGLRRTASDVRGLRVVLYSNGSTAGPEFKAPNKPADVLRFVIRDGAGTGHPRIDKAGSSDRAYVARRKLERGRRSDLLTVEDEGGQKREVMLGGPAMPIDSGMEIAFHDRTQGGFHNGGPHSSGESAGSVGGAGSAGGVGPAGSAGASPAEFQDSTIDPNADPWLGR